VSFAFAFAFAFSFSFASTGCSPSKAPKPAPDLSTVVETFAPSKTPIGQAFGFSWHPRLGADNSADLDRLQQLGAGAVRWDFSRSDIEKTPGTYDFAAWDAAVGDLAARNIATIGLLNQNGGDENAPADVDGFAAFAEATARHFRGQVQAWEVWNEQNLGFRFWKPAEDPTGYGVLLARVHDAVKRGDPAARVVFGGLNSQGLSSTAEDFLNDAYFAHPDLGSSYDALGIHPYPDYPPQHAPEDTVGLDRALGLKLSRLRAMLVYYGDADKGLWVTEYGWPVYMTVDEAAQASYCARAAIEAVATGADRVMLYTLDDGPHPTAFPPEDAFGVVRNDGTHKPAFDALAQLVGHDPTAVLVEDRSTATMRTYVFAGAQKRFSVSWTLTPGAPLVYVDNP